MAEVIIPNRSFLAFQRPADKSAYGWRNSQPLRFGKNDTGYQWNEFNRFTDMPSLQNQYYFCRDSVSGEKQYVYSLENSAKYFNSDIQIKDILAMVSYTVANKDNPEEILSWHFVPTTSYIQLFESGTKVGTQVLYWHLFSIYFETGPIEQNPDDYTEYRLRNFMYSFNSELPSEFINALSQGISYGEVTPQNDRFNLFQADEINLYTELVGTQPQRLAINKNQPDEYWGLDRIFGNAPNTSKVTNSTMLYL